MDNDRCPDCGRMFALVGRSHNCRPVTAEFRAKAAAPVAVSDALRRSLAAKGLIEPRKEVVPAEPKTNIRSKPDTTPPPAVLDRPVGAAYRRYKKPEKRKEYMREYMRRWRLAKKAKR